MPEHRDRDPSDILALHHHRWVQFSRGAASGRLFPTVIGTTIHLRATTGERGNDVRLDCRLELAHVGEVESRPLSDSITGQAPQWHRQTIALATDLAAGHSMLISGSTAERAETREEEPTNVLWRASTRLFQSRGDERPRESTQLYLLVTPRLLEL